MRFDHLRSTFFHLLLFLSTVSAAGAHLATISTLLPPHIYPLTRLKHCADPFFAAFDLNQTSIPSPPLPSPSLSSFPFFSTPPSYGHQTFLESTVVQLSPERSPTPSIRSSSSSASATAAAAAVDDRPSSTSSSLGSQLQEEEEEGS